jgi:hypothetical protein
MLPVPGTVLRARIVPLLSNRSASFTPMADLPVTEIKPALVKA